MSLIESQDSALLEYLKQHGVRFERFEVGTKGRQAAETKAYLLKVNKADRYFLVVARPTARFDIEELQLIFNIRSLTMSSPDETFRVLGALPEGLSLLALASDVKKRVTLALDVEIWNAQASQHLALTPASTIILSAKELRSFLKLIHQVPQVIALQEVEGQNR